ncbi:response regulator [Curvivirga aplysinae]|uniref:response regulator n=1 Tax=Curvivirga aplysinae TaxID=2529852 RepID=UPI0012BBBCDE|nr:response regulator transcription factor [Curvivirga aplysinae]MTI10228.1 response regulator transcription factor [Curvivirga aplysinae]
MVEETHVLVVDDDAEIRDLLQRFLSKEGYRVTVAEDAADARNKLAFFEFDLLIVDVMMPGETGLEFTESLRTQTTVPILMLTAMGETEARIAGLKAGADDYLAKPFEPMELILRIQSILRRSFTMPETDANLEDSREIKLGASIFDMDREILVQGEATIKLTTTEIALLKALAGVRGEVMSREELCEKSNVDSAGRTVDVQVTRLRRKIEPDPKNPRYLHTVRGQGYVLRPDN